MLKPRSPKSGGLLWVALLPAALACSAQVGTSSRSTDANSSMGGPGSGTGGAGSGGTGAGTGGTAGGDGTGGVAPGTGGQVFMIPAGAPGPTALRRLTNEEYRATLQDLLQLGEPPADPLIPNARQSGYENFSAVLSVPAILGAQYATMAQRLATEANIAALAPCASSAAESECANAFIDAFGKRVHRQPLSTKEQQGYRALYHLTVTTDSYEAGIRRVLEAMLQSPALIYRTEYGVGAAERTLTPYEIASQLSYLFTGSMPDAELMQAADANALGSSAQVEAQARRLLALSRTQAHLGRFVEQWFLVSDMSALMKNEGLFPDFASSQKAAMEASTSRFVSSVLWEGDGTVNTLLSAPYAFVNSALAPVFGVADPGGSALVRTEVGDLGRRGFLTMPSLLASQAKEVDSDPVKRGKFVRTRMFCQSLPPPPAGEVIEAPAPNPNLTTRERFAEHSVNPSCSGCHALIDPIGFGLESYDAIGAYRTEENGRPVDSSGNLNGTDVDGPFVGGVELATRLSTSALVRTCAAIQAARFTFGRMEIETDKQVATTLETRLGAAGMDMRELFVELTKSESFIKRTLVP